MELYGSRLEEYAQTFGDFTALDAAEAFAGAICMGWPPTTLIELTYAERKRVHNLKYYTWVEQQGKSFEEIQAQWYDPDYWTAVQGQVGEIDAKITEFNQKVNL